MPSNKVVSPLVRRLHLGARCALAMAVALTAASLRADVFELQNGGQVVGELVDRTAEGDYQVKSLTGVQLTLTDEQVRRVVTQEKEELEYARRSRALPDTVEAHRQLAEWCKEVGLKKQTDLHLARLLQLDPNDEQARLSLGYQLHRGRWLTRDEVMAERGMRYYDGAYRSAQDIALREQAKQQEQAENDWFRQIRIWLGWLDDRRAVEAENSIVAIDDPAAAPALVRLLERARDQGTRDLLTRTLAPLRHVEAARKLVDLSIDDPLEDVRLECLEYLLKYHRPISLSPYVRALRDRDNVIVNRAAMALRVIGDPEAISPLINALVTSHKYANPDAPPGEINAAFSPSGGGGGLSFGNAPKVVNVPHQNVEVRRALVELSRGQDFDYNQQAWRRWFVNQQIHQDVDTRRDL